MSPVVCIQSFINTVVGWVSQGPGWFNYTNDTNWSSIGVDYVWVTNKWVYQSNGPWETFTAIGLPSGFRPTHIAIDGNGSNCTVDVIDKAENTIGTLIPDYGSYPLTFVGYDIDRLEFDTGNAGVNDDILVIEFYEP